jgi:myo-inositol-1(or 4)-monophosphatase
MMDKILAFIEHAGKYALENQSRIDFEKSTFKSKGIGDPVTEIDTAISGMFLDFVTKNFGGLDYLIIDEESASGLGEKPMEKIARAEYLFVIDPIDGTLPYANKYPFWAISIGVFKNGKPWIGASYAPALDLLVWSDETKAYFRENGKTAELSLLKDSAPIVMEYHDSKKIHVNDNNDDKRIQGLRVYSQIVSAMYVAIGRACGCYYQTFIWDIAGIMPVLDKVGVKIQDFENRADFDFKTAWGQNLRANKAYIVSQPKYFDSLKSIVDIKI